jgi:hypothetical protein
LFAIFAIPNAFSQTAPMRHAVAVCATCVNTYSFVSYAKSVPLTSTLLLGTSQNPTFFAQASLILGITSSAAAETSYVELIATWNENHGWGLEFAQPVDSVGNDLPLTGVNATAGSSANEAANEGVFTAIDADGFGASRNSPIVVTADPNFCSSFIDSDDGEVDRGGPISPATVLPSVSGRYLHNELHLYGP